MSAALDQLLRLVAEGRLSPDEAAPLVAALDDPGVPDPQGATPGSRGSQPAGSAASGRPSATGRAAGTIHIEVREHGRPAVDLRVPLALGFSAARMVPGLAPEYIQRIREALSAGIAGPILDLVDEDGDGVRISLDRG